MTQSTRIYKHSAAGTDWAALMLGAGLGLTLALQATTLRSVDFAGFYAVVVTVSRLAALVGTYLSVVGIFLVARIPVVERGVGHDRLVTWHRKLGPWSLYLIGAHVFLIVLGFAGQDQIPLYKEMWQFLTVYDWMWFALAGFVLMVMALSIGYWRFWVPIWRSLKVNLQVEKVVVEGPGVISVIMKGRNLDRLAAQGGQFFGWRFLTRGHALMSHPYSLSAAPTKNHLRITVKDLGDHSRSLAFLRPGTRVFVEGPYGAFTAGRSTSPHVVLIGGGVGITPVRALMDEFNGGAQIDVIFRASREEDLVLKAEMDYLADRSGGSMRIHYLVGSREDHPMDAKALKALVPTFADSDIYICGPAPLVSAVRKAAEDLGVPKNRFHDEAFAFHSE